MSWEGGSATTPSRTLVAESPDGTRIAFEDLGAGEPLVLLHGVTESRECWREAGYVEAFLRQRRRVILIDCRGHGESDKPHDPSAYEATKRAADIIAVLDRASIRRAALMGHSMGGAIAIAGALHQPQRVAALIVNGAHPFAEDMAPYRAALRDGFEDWIKLLERQAPSLSEATRRRIRANDLAAIVACVAHDRPDVSAGWTGTTMPVLAISGAQDSRYDQVRRFAEMVNGRLLSLPERNHITAFLDAQEAVTSAVDEFLGRIE